MLWYVMSQVIVRCSLLLSHLEDEVDLWKWKKNNTGIVSAKHDLCGILRFEDVVAPNHHLHPSLSHLLLSSHGCSGLRLGTLHSWLVDKQLLVDKNPGKPARMVAALWFLFIYEIYGLFIKQKIDLPKILNFQQQKVRYSKKMGNQDFGQILFFVRLIIIHE